MLCAVFDLCIVYYVLHCILLYYFPFSVLTNDFSGLLFCIYYTPHNSSSVPARTVSRRRNPSSGRSFVTRLPCRTNKKKRSSSTKNASCRNPPPGCIDTRPPPRNIPCEPYIRVCKEWRRGWTPGKPKLQGSWHRTKPKRWRSGRQGTEAGWRNKQRRRLLPNNHKHPEHTTCLPINTPVSISTRFVITWSRIVCTNDSSLHSHRSFTITPSCAGNSVVDPPLNPSVSTKSRPPTNPLPQQQMPLA